MLAGIFVCSIIGGMNAKLAFFVMVLALLLLPGVSDARAVCKPCDSNFQCDPGLVCLGDNPATERGEGICQYTDSNKITLCNPLSADSFTDIINNIMNFLFGVAIVFTPIMVVFAGFMFLTAGGNPAQFTKARSLLLWTAVGFGVILLAKGLTTVLRQIIGF
ncbi:MAG: hypothetical protein A2842_02190 [Candidatus Wildermuthbacteria bacterium RIFCSPHIGHO2_01_FULL_48_25]|uniref:Uncharacterized protein n=1 Tax=Candidatus Wildermuthbacteria bacterium RIFCSPLOWO2_01_FULL_48_16 TaxID=1802461 RepID=A0A1G2RK73_9BACT|nr:MAG: hypothetical protein A2842_02190 [Candidatus Wildermuthbacteria bacterium RIFCSPHIGHO2_01_FULL_48_25]OHA69337.1 MAG: hypothetical protein A3J57_02035 [Candidatus Wildermuthbacteria bacterium RIFCSPHIGHO2_02_FULL_49_12b]OHA73187.1 MAG: hypothetical protein A3B24_00915 [Candidatus Wildermuthbacteria bacterium RIFCSPLOWO2_01_FULL_48_16]